MSDTIAITKTTRNSSESGASAGNSSPLKLSFERTADYALVKHVITHPKIWPHAVDDFACSPEQWEPTQSELVWYVLVKDGAEVLGLFMLVQENAICWKVHTCLLPTAWGQRAKLAAREGVQWVWTNTPCLRLVTDVPEYNTLALRFAHMGGMTQFGVNLKSYMKSGRLQDVILLGISKEAA